VDAVEGFYGVRTFLTGTVGEYFRAFRNADLLVEGFEIILLRNWTYFERSKDRSRLFALPAEPVLGLLETPLTSAQFSLMLRGLLTWCTAALNGPHGTEYDETLVAVGESPTRLLPRQPAASTGQGGALLRHVTRRRHGQASRQDGRGRVHGP